MEAYWPARMRGSGIATQRFAFDALMYAPHCIAHLWTHQLDGITETIRTKGPGRTRARTDCDRRFMANTALACPSATSQAHLQDRTTRPKEHGVLDVSSASASQRGPRSPLSEDDRASARGLYVACVSLRVENKDGRALAIPAGSCTCSTDTIVRGARREAGRRATARVVRGARGREQGEVLDAFCRRLV